MRRLCALALMVVIGACGGDPSPRFTTRATRTTTTPAPVLTTTTIALAPPATEVVDVAYRIEIRTADPVGRDFASIVDATLHDDRGWQRARFRLTDRDDAEYVVMLAEPADAQELCKPYDVYSKYSCQNGPRVVLNAERWREATPQWTGDLATYRQMLVNHEFGHLLGQHHPASNCPAPGRPAAVMSQQSTELNGCLPNPWPLDWEIAQAARHDEPLAPPYSR